MACIGSCDDVQDPRKLMFHFSVPRPVSLSEGGVRERHYMGVAIASCYVGGMIAWIQTLSIKPADHPSLVGKGSHVGAVLVETPPLLNDDMGNQDTTHVHVYTHSQLHNIITMMIIMQ